jgi:hypothetical protein
MRIREEGLTVLGFGEQKTPEAFKNACHKFIFTEVLRPITQNTPPRPPPKTGKQVKKATEAPPSPPPESPREFPKKFVLEALEQSSDDEGWANLATFGSYLTKLQPDFDSRVFGYKKLSDLVKSKTDIFLTEERKLPGSSKKILYVKALSR